MYAALAWLVKEEESLWLLGAATIGKYEYYLLFIVTLGPPREAEGVDTQKNEFSQRPLGKPLRHYTILAHCTRCSYAKNIWLHSR